MSEKSMPPASSSVVVTHGPYFRFFPVSGLHAVTEESDHVWMPKPRKNTDFCLDRLRASDRASEFPCSFEAIMHSSNIAVNNLQHNTKLMMVYVIICHCIYLILTWAGIELGIISSEPAHAAQKRDMPSLAPTVCHR